jgi:hypothetical protein
MSRPRDTHRISFLFLPALLLLSQLAVACTAPGSSTGRTAPSSSATATGQTRPSTGVTATATVPLLPTISVDSGWKIVFKTAKDNTALGAGSSQNFKFDQFPPNTSFIVYGTCTGNGSAKFTIKGTNGDGSATFTSILSVTCTPSGTSASAELSSAGGGNGGTVAKGGVAGVKNTSDVVEKATVNLTITGPIKWELVVEEPAQAVFLRAM